MHLEHFCSWSHSCISRSSTYKKMTEIDMLKKTPTQNKNNSKRVDLQRLTTTCVLSDLVFVVVQHQQKSRLSALDYFLCCCEKYVCSCRGDDEAYDSQSCMNFNRLFCRRLPHYYYYSTTMNKWDTESTEVPFRFGVKARLDLPGLSMNAINMFFLGS